MYKNRNLFLTTPEASKSKIIVLTGSVSWRAALCFQNGALLYPGEKRNAVSLKGEETEAQSCVKSFL
jgi:hypothetical protein